jgi:hypothetical protein
MRKIDTTMKPPAPAVSPASRGPLVLSPTLAEKTAAMRILHPDRFPAVVVEDQAKPPSAGDTAPIGGDTAVRGGVGDASGTGEGKKDTTPIGGDTAVKGGVGKGGEPAKAQTPGVGQTAPIGGDTAVKGGVGPKPEGTAEAQPSGDPEKKEGDNQPQNVKEAAIRAKLTGLALTEEEVRIAWAMVQEAKVAKCLAGKKVLKEFAWPPARTKSGRLIREFNWRAHGEKKKEIPFQSQSNPDNSYKIANWEDGSWSCNCMDWTRRPKVDDQGRRCRMCKHVSYSGGKRNYDV